MVSPLHPPNHNTSRNNNRNSSQQNRHAYKHAANQTSWALLTSVVVLLAGASSFHVSPPPTTLGNTPTRQGHASLLRTGQIMVTTTTANVPSRLRLLASKRKNGGSGAVVTSTGDEGALWNLYGVSHSNSHSHSHRHISNHYSHSSNGNYNSNLCPPTNSDFELQLGRALDTLRKDYPYLLVKSPNFEIYSPDIQVVDPSGVTLHSLQSYKNSFYFLHMVVRLFYCPDKSGLTFRLAYDCARKNIRVSWNAELVPRIGGNQNKLYIDGISVYELDRQSGLINQHRVERLLLNDAPVSPPPQGIFALLQETAVVYGGRTGLLPGTEGVGIPSWVLGPHPTSHHLVGGRDEQSMVLPFSSSSSWMVSSRLFSTSDRQEEEHPSSLYAQLHQQEHPNPHPQHSQSQLQTTQPEGQDLFDRDKFNRKNASRKKFGLPPITEAEYVQIEEKTRELEQVQRQKAAAASSSAAEMTKGQGDVKKSNIFGNLFGNVLKDTCQSNADCERPEVCCDFGFKKMCCRSGMKVFNGVPGQLQPIPVRVVADDDQWQRRGGPEGVDWGY